MKRVKPDPVANRLRGRLLIDLLAPARRTRVVEVGANPINVNPYAGLMALEACDVVGFEPEEKAFARLSQGAHETYLPYAIGNGSMGDLHVCRAVSLSSLLKPDRRTTEFFSRMNGPATVDKVVPVQTHRLDNLAEVLPFDLLKIDVQGGEIQVYDGAQEKLKTALVVITEVAFVPLYEDQPLIDAQIASLRAAGMDLHKFLFLKGFSLRGGLNSALDKQAHDNQLLDGDAVFLRSLRHPEAFSDEDLKHMAILADVVVQSYDISLRCLDHLIARGVLSAEAVAPYVRLVPQQAED